jgi:hypothetical protein
MEKDINYLTLGQAAKEKKREEVSQQSSRPLITAHYHLLKRHRLDIN